MSRLEHLQARKDIVEGKLKGHRGALRSALDEGITMPERHKLRTKIVILQSELDWLRTEIGKEEVK